MPSDLLPAWEGFQAQAERVETARQALLRCLPVGRVDPVPVPVGLDLLRDELAGVSDELGDWRIPQVERHWLACRDAIREAVAAMGHAHEVSTASTELEELLGAVAEVVEPLDAWHDAERHWLSLRTRSTRS